MIEAELRDAYELRKPALRALGLWVTEVIKVEIRKQLGSDDGVTKFLQLPPHPRVKETDSFLEKALIRKRKEDPLTEITDQVGIRFVVLLLEDIDRLGKVIEAGNWTWQKDRDHESERLANPDYFAYQSDHYVIRTKEQFEFEGVTVPSQLPCEIQVRTILQHAYAEMAHSSDYKPSIKLPEEEQKRVKRALAKGSALIETTDDVFREIKTRLREYNDSIDALLNAAGDIYMSATGEPATSPTAFSVMIADAYRSLLGDTKPEHLRAWAESRPWLGERLVAKRPESVFYRDPVVVLLGWLVTEHEMTTPKLWPADSTYLEDYYTFLGVSTNGLF